MGFVIRSRYSQTLEEEKASLFYAAREMKNVRNNIDALKINDAIVKDYPKIQQTILSFFTALFNGFHDSNLLNTDYTHFQDFMQGLGSMSNEESGNLEEAIEMDELEFVLKCCKNNKSPGLDGLPYEFYRSVWPIIRTDFRNILQCQLNRVKIIDSNKEGVTRLLSKVKGVPKVDELRPITLLNTDYKILSKLLVKRVKPILGKVILSR